MLQMRPLKKRKKESEKTKSTSWEKIFANQNHVEILLHTHQDRKKGEKERGKEKRIIEREGGGREGGRKEGVEKKSRANGDKSYDPRPFLNPGTSNLRSQATLHFGAVLCTVPCRVFSRFLSSAGQT